MNTKIAHKYVPAFSTREAELKAYAALEGDVKDQILPVITLTRQRSAIDLGSAISCVVDAAETRPVIVDFDRLLKTAKTEEDATKERKAKRDKVIALGNIPKVYTEKQEEAWRRRRGETREAVRLFNDELLKLQNPSDGYSAWRSLCLSVPNLIPTAQLGNSTEATEQVEAILAAGRDVAFRVDLCNPKALPAFLSAVRAVGQPDKAHMILDAGHVRGDVTGGYRLVVEALAAVRSYLGHEVFGGLQKVCMAGSFPSTLRGLPSELRILERDLYESVVRDGWDVRYGDHASIQQRSTMQASNGWFPHVDVSHERAWHVGLREDFKSKKQGYIEAAKTLVSTEGVWKERADCWGANMVARASLGELTDADGKMFTTPGPWLGVRMNQHLKKQVSVV